ncbi:MAG: peptidoglycan DD-metalloendopeptidase family protein, partial [Alphaproteobacteria bacterium]
SCLGAQSPAPVNIYGGNAGAGSAGSHVVKEGDTLWSISKRYNIVMRDIAYANKLRAPFLLDTGQRLKLPPPPEYRVRAGDSLYEISRLFNTSTSELARLNNLRAPYSIKPGQKLRLPSVRPQAVQVASSRAAPKASGAGVIPPRKPSATAASPSPKPVTARPLKVSKAPPKRSSSKFLTPVQGRVISSFGPKEGGLHNDGVNFAAPRGTPVKASENGVVVYAGNELKGSGNLILIRHEGRYMSAYAHLDSFMIKRGDTVSRGQTIGTVGSTGAVSAPQLHFEIRKGTRAINPKGYIAG